MVQKQNEQLLNEELIFREFQRNALKITFPFIDIDRIKVTVL